MFFSNGSQWILTAKYTYCDKKKHAHKARTTPTDARNTQTNVVHVRTTETDKQSQTEIYRQIEKYCAGRECQYKPTVKQCDLNKEVVQKEWCSMLTQRIEIC